MRRNALTLFAACMCACACRAHTITLRAATASAAPANAKNGAAMRVAWTYNDVFSYAVTTRPGGGHGLLVTPRRGDRIDRVDLDTGVARPLAVQPGWIDLYSTGTSIALGARVDRLEALDPAGASLWTIDRPASSVRGVAGTAAGIALLSEGSVETYSMEGRYLWRQTISRSVNRVTSLDGAIVAWNEPLPLQWTILDAVTGRVVGAGTEPAGSLVAQAGRLVTCATGRVTVMGLDGTRTATLPYGGECGDMTVDDDTVYVSATTTAKHDAPGEVHALAIGGRAGSTPALSPSTSTAPEKTERWQWRGPVAYGAIVFGPWLLVPSKGGIVRALRRTDGTLAWSYGVGGYLGLRAVGDGVLLSMHESLRMLQRTSLLEPERTSEITVVVHQWNCTGPDKTVMLVGDSPASSSGANRYVARVTARGSVLVHTSAHADVLLAGSTEYSPLSVGIDGAPHTVDVDVDDCSEDED